MASLKSIVKTENQYTVSFELVAAIIFGVSTEVVSNNEHRNKVCLWIQTKLRQGEGSQR
jgi:hypothetical protein